MLNKSEANQFYNIPNILAITYRQSLLPNTLCEPMPTARGGSDSISTPRGRGRPRSTQSREEDRSTSSGRFKKGNQARQSKPLGSSHGILDVI